MNRLIPEIIYQDKYIAVLNKPTGLVVHKGAGVKEKYTLVDFLIDERIISGDWKDKNRAGIVHRLDKDTSGLMIIAKNPKVAKILKHQFKNRENKKNYIALVWGKTPAEDMILSSIGRKPRNANLMTVGRGKKAQTNYQTIKHYLKNHYQLSLVKIDLKTGRTHQIRVHFKSIGHPLVGDTLYAKNKLNKISQKWGIDRLFLHSLEIKFNHPITKKQISLKSELPKELKDFLLKLI